MAKGIPQPIKRSALPSPRLAAAAAGSRLFLPTWVLVGVKLAAILTMTGTLAALGYYSLFSTFQDYDDEGYVLVTVKQFIQGHALYDQVYTQYGPFFYWFNWVLFRSGHFPVSHDTAGLMMIAVWLVCALLAAVFVLRLTGSVLLGLAVELLVFRHLYGFAYEPAHPQGVCVLLILALAALGTGCSADRRTLVCAATGVVAGCLLLVKVNVGAFAVLALMLTISAATPGRVFRVFAAATGLAMLALPAVLMQHHLDQAWGLNYALLVTISGLPVILINTGERFFFLRPRDTLVAALAGMAALAVVALLTWIHGTSVAGLLEGALLQHGRFAGVAYLPAAVHTSAVVAALLGVVAFLAYRRLERHFSRHPAVGRVVTTAKAFFACGTLALAATLGFYGLLSYALPFVWLAAVGLPPAIDPRQAFARRLLICLAVMQSLAAYPVAGTQLSLATLLLVLSAAVCLGDVLTGSLRTSLVLGGLAVVALIWATWEMAAFRQRHLGLTPLGLAGAARLRIDELHVAAYRWLDASLRAEADTFITMPGINSLYLWTEKEPPTTYNATAWMTLFGADRQKRIVEALETYPRACAVRNRELAERWLRGQRIEGLPLVRSIREDFHPVGNFAGYEFLSRSGRTLPELSFCAIAESNAVAGNWTARVVLPPLASGMLSRLVVADPRNGRVYADSAGVRGAAKLEVRLTGERPVDLATRPLDLTQGCKFLVTTSKVVPAGVPLVIRLVDESGAVAAPVPVLE
jgi:hypothetical protein